MSTSASDAPAEVSQVASAGSLWGGGQLGAEVGADTDAEADAEANAGAAAATELTERSSSSCSVSDERSWSW